MAICGIPWSSKLTKLRPVGPAIARVGFGSARVDQGHKRFDCPGAMPFRV